MVEKQGTQDIILFRSQDRVISVPVQIKEETVWLTQAQMVTLFETTKQNVSLHINNCFREKELDKKSVVKDSLTTAADGKKYKTAIYNLDVIISVGYRVKSQRGVEFRRWANDVLKRYIIKGYAVNDTRIRQLGEVLRVLKRAAHDPDAQKMLDVIEKYARALELLDDYDHQRLKKPEGTQGAYVLTYEECKALIAQMKFHTGSAVFGNEKDESFQSSINAIYQSFDGRDVYPSMEEKAANLLYFITKNHSFTDGNKRIAAAVFLYFMDKSGLLFADGVKRMDDHTLVAVTIMIAESKPEEKETMIHLVMNLLQ